MDNYLFESLMEDSQFIDIMMEDMLQDTVIGDILIEDFSSFMAGQKFTFKNMDLIFKNMMFNANDTGDFEKIRENMLKMIARCKTLKELEYLRKEINMSIPYFKKYAEIVSAVENNKTVDMRLSETHVKNIKKRIDKGLTSKKIRDHHAWLINVYRKAMNDKAKELREKNK